MELLYKNTINVVESSKLFTEYIKLVAKPLKIVVERVELLALSKYSI